MNLFIKSRISTNMSNEHSVRFTAENFGYFEPGLENPNRFPPLLSHTTEVPGREALDTSLPSKSLVRPSHGQGQSSISYRGNGD